MSASDEEGKEEAQAIHAQEAQEAIHAQEEKEEEGMSILVLLL